MQSNHVRADIPALLYTSHKHILPFNGLTELRNMTDEGDIFEVEILRDKTDDLVFDKDIGEILNLNQYTCHICNINVPKSYAKEHNNSKKHKTCKEIANIGLERAKLQIELEFYPLSKIEVQDTYFCESCSTVVLSSHEELHKSTKIHLVSMKHDEMLVDLLNIYKDIENVEVNSEIDELDILKQNIEDESLQELESLEADSVDNENNAKELELLEADLVHSKNNAKELESLEVDSIDNDNNAKVATDVNAFREKILNSVITRFNFDVLEQLQQEKNIVYNLKTDINKLQKYNNKLQEIIRQLLDRQNKPEFKNIQGLKNCVFVLSGEPTEPRHDTQMKSSMLKKLETAKQSNQLVTAIDKELLIADKDKTKEVAVKDDTNSNSDIDKEESNDSKSIDKSSVVKKDTEFLRKHAYLDIVTSKVESIMSRYFAKTCTVDALKSNIEIDKNKEKLGQNKSITKKKSKNKQFMNADKENKEQQNSPVLKENTEQNNNNINQNRNSNTATNKNKLSEEKQEQNKTRDKNTNTINLPKKSKPFQEKQEEATKTSNHIKEETHEKKSPEQIKTTKPQDINKKEATTKDTRNKKEASTKDTTNKKQDNTKVQTKITNKEVKTKAPGFNLVNYVKDLTRRCETKPIHTVEAITDTIVQITAINGDKFKILVNNFHSFHVKSNSIFCKICERPDIRRMEWHIVESEHRAKVMIPIHDLNGIRQLDDIWSHCVLCNDLTTDIEFHLQSLHHNNKVKQSLVELGHEPEEEKQKKTSPKQNPNKAAFMMELIQANNLHMTDKKYLNCTICDVIVDYTVPTVHQHITSFDHLNNFELKKNENKIVNTAADKFYCIPCDLHIRKLDIVPHCKGKRHSCMLNDYLVKQGEEINKTDEEIMVLESISQNVKKLSKEQMDDSGLICFVCNTIIFSTDEHMDSFDHKKKYYTYLETNKLNETDPDTFYCIPCNVIIGIDYLMNHCVSTKHKRILAIFKSNTGAHLNSKNCNDEEEIKNKEALCIKCSNNGHDKNVPELDVREEKNSQPSTSLTHTSGTSYNKSMPLKVLYQFQELKASANLLCMVCDEEVAYTRKLASYHISTLEHVVAFNLTMLWNKIKKCDDKYFCDICGCDITYFSELDHVLGKEHTENLAKQPKGTVYEYDRTLLTHSYAMSHKVGDRIRPSPIVAYSSKSEEIQQ